MTAFLHSFGPLFLMSFGGSAISVVCVLMGSDPCNTFMQVWTSGFCLGVLAWIETDARQRRRTPFFDFGYLISFGMPLTLFWYLFKTRGWWTFLLVPMLYFVWMIPAISMAIAWASIYG